MAIQDLTFENHGSLFLARPNTQVARDWLAEHCPPDDDHQYFGSAVVIEHRYAHDLAQYAVNDGLSVG